jgi:hypothetical protein
VFFFLIRCFTRTNRSFFFQDWFRCILFPRFVFVLPHSETNTEEETDARAEEDMRQNAPALSVGFLVLSTRTNEKKESLFV